MPLSDICTESRLAKCSYENAIDKSLDQDTVNWTQLLPDDKWDNLERSNAEIELNQTNAIKNSQERQNSDPQGEF